MGLKKARASAVPSAKLIVEEVLSVVLSPRRVRAVLADACRLAGLGTVPDAPISLRVFVEGALFSTLSRLLGISDALNVSEQIRGALALALREDIVDEQSGIRLRRDSSDATPQVIVLSQASVVVFLLEDMLASATMEEHPANVVRLTSQEELENRLLRRSGEPVLIVVDRRHPCVGSEACHVLMRSTPLGSTVIWWGADEQEQAQVASQLLNGPHLIPTAPEMELADLGVLCCRTIDLM